MHRVFFAAGPGNIISAHDYWKRGEHEPTEVSITFSSQVAEFCKRANSPAYFVAYKSPPARLNDGPFTLEHRPKPFPGANGIKYHLSEMIYAWGLCRTARKFRATVAVLKSGTSHFFMGWLFRLVGIPVVTILHNTIWPAGFPPTKLAARLVRVLDGLFFRWGSSANIAVSPECSRQLNQLTHGHHGPLYEIRAQFLPERFAPIGPPPSYDGSLLRIMFIGRVNRAKGVFDILAMAEKLECKYPGRIQWEICGRGPAYEELKVERDRLGLRNVAIPGWVSLDTLQQVYNRSHIAIVPTRSDFAEGLAMTAAEAILAGRPFIANPTVPALEVLRPAALAGQTNDVDSYVKVIEELLVDPTKYQRLCKECKPLQQQFYNRRRGLTEVLATAIANLNIGDTSKAP